MRSVIESKAFKDDARAMDRSEQDAFQCKDAASKTIYGFILKRALASRTLDCG